MVDKEFRGKRRGWEKGIAHRRGGKQGRGIIMRELEGM